MNSKGHLVISMVKSCIRIFGSVIAIKKKSVKILACSILGAEVLGITEELVDKR